MKRQGKPGEQIKLVAVPDEGYEFDGWSRPGILFKNNPLLYKYGKHHETITAEFKPVEEPASILTINTSSGGRVMIEPVEKVLHPKTSGELEVALASAPDGSTIDLGGHGFRPIICQRNEITLRNGGIVSNGNDPCVRIVPGVRNVRFEKVNFLAAPGQNNMVEVGVDTNGRSVTTPDQIPDGIQFTDCAFDGTSANLINALLLNCNNFLVDNCKLHNIVSNGESHAINVLYSNGPGVVRDSYIESAGIGFFVGGAPAVPGIWPTGISVYGNLFTKNSSWQPPIQQKCHLELKTGRNIDISGNVFQDNPRGQQVGASIVFTPRDGAEILNVDFHTNLIDNSHSGFQLMNRDHNPPIAGPMRGINIHRNVLTRIASKHFLFSPTDGSQPINGLIIRHNTCVHNQVLQDNDSAAFIFANSGPLPFAENVAFEKNIATLGHNGILRSGGAVGQSSIDEIFSAPSLGNNVASGRNIFPLGNEALYPRDFCLQGFVWFGRDKGIHKDNRVDDEGAPAEEIQEMAAAIRKKWA